MLYRVLPFRAGVDPLEEGGALWVPRESQGSGRHDNPDRYGALYAARAPESAVAERIQAFRGQTLADRDLRRADGRPLSLGAIDDAALPPLVDLDDPRELARRRLRPSMVATRERSATRAIALDVFEGGAVGLLWWSTLEAFWTNVTLFAERATPLLRVEAEPEPLTIRHPAVRSAAEVLGIGIAR